MKNTNTLKYRDKKKWGELYFAKWCVIKIQIFTNTPYLAKCNLAKCPTPKKMYKKCIK